MAKIKILFIANNNIGFGLSGGDNIFIQLLKHWQNKCHLTLLGSQEAFNISKPFNIKNIKKVITDSVNNNSQNTNINLFFHYIRRTIRVIKTINNNYSQIVSNNYVYSVSDFLPDFIPALYLKLKNPQIKWIAGFYLFAPSPWSSHTPYKGTKRIKGLIYWLIQKITLPLINKYADIIFVTSKPEVSRFKYPKKVIVIMGGVDLDDINDYKNNHPKIALSKRPYDACFLGRFHPQKGLLELIDIWNIVVSKSPKSRLAIIGQGELEKAMKNRVNKLKLGKNIKIFSFLNGNPKYRIFSQSKIVLHPAIYDSGGMAAAEAMGYGLPGVSFDLESLKTYYPAGMVKTPCFNKEKFAANILKLLDNPIYYKTISHEAKMLIRREWNWKYRSEEIFDNITKLNE